MEHEQPHDPLVAAIEALGTDDEPGDVLMLQVLRRSLGLTESPPRIGRFIIRKSLGTGGMGAVFAAEDPHLNRDVALKLLRRVPGDDPLRGLAEARVLARLSHPNVVAVHEAGLHDNQVYLVMELVEGQTLSEWLAVPRRWQDVCEIMLDAGRGVAAAHAAGIVHCDLKPDNILIGDRVRVADFGLARPSPDPVTTDEASSAAAPGRGGTMAFMAPEQLRGDTADPRSDQFSLCATFFLALDAQPPFSGDDPVTRRAAIEHGVPRGRPARVPRWLRAMVRRGLEARADRRYPRLDDLLEELERRLNPRPWIGLGAATMVAALAGLVGSVTAGSPDAECQATAQVIDEVWNPARREAIASAFQSVDRPYAAHALTFVTESVDRYAADWAQARVETCLAQPPDHLPAATVGCLEQQRSQLDALLAQLEAADAEVVEKAATSVSALPPPRECARASSEHEYETMADEADQRRLDAAREGLASGWALEQVGRYAEAREALQPALAELRALDQPALIALALLRLGRNETPLGALDDAHEHLQEALELALLTRADLVAAHAAMASCDELTKQGHVDRAHEAAGIAAMMHQRWTGEPHWPQLSAMVGNLLLREHRDQEVVETLTAAIASARDGPPSQERFLLPMNVTLSNALSRLGRIDEAEAALDEARALATHTLGEDHPMFAILLLSVANILSDRGDPEAALAEQLRGLEIWRRAMPEPNRITASMTFNAGIYAMELGQLERGLQWMTEALELSQRLLPSGHPNLALIRTGIGTTLRELGELEESLAHHELALATIREHANAYEPEAGYPLLEAARSALAAKQPERARQWASQGLEAFADAPNPTMEGELHFERAKCLAMLGDAEAARAEARAALVLLRETDDADANIDAIESWLASLTPTPASGPAP